MFLVKLFEDKNAFQLDVWADRRTSSRAERYIDRENKILILKGIIPGMSEKSEIRFVKLYRTPDNKHNYKTEWIDSVSSQQ